MRSDITTRQLKNLKEFWHKNSPRERGRELMIFIKKDYSPVLFMDMYFASIAGTVISEPKTEV